MSEFKKPIEIFRVNADATFELGKGVDPLVALGELSKAFMKQQHRLKQLEYRIHRASIAFFRDGSDGHVASQMLQILEEERGNVSKEPLQSDSSIWAKAGIGFTTEDKP